VAATAATANAAALYGRLVVTDHGSFVLFNVYVPNAGERPERARLAAKLAFLQALKERVDSLLMQGRQVS
jgi:exonuclease III